MTETSFPWGGTTIGDAGPYSADNWHDLWKFVLHGFRANMGPILDSGTAPDIGLKVQATTPVSSSVEVLSGAALVEGAFYHSDATETLAVTANASGNPRIDTVALEKDYTAQTIRVVLIAGTPAATPAPPTLTQTDGTLWQIPIADIAVANGFLTIGNGVITPRHEWANAADGVYLRDMLNNSGATLTTGSVVIIDTSADRAVTTTTTADDKRAIGVWVGRTNNGAYGRVLVRGVGFVYSSAAVTRGQLLTTTTTAGQVAPVTSGLPVTGSMVGRALETTAGAGLVLAYINTHNVHYLDFVHVQDQKASGTAAASVTLGAWRTRELNTEVADTGSLASVAANQITLQPGVWAVFAVAPNGNASTAGRIRMRDTTGGTTLVQGTNGGVAGSAQGSNALVLYGIFTITVASVLELQQYQTATGTGGAAVSSGEVEVYANVFLWRIGEN